MWHVIVEQSLAVNMIWNTAVFYVAYRIYLRPRLASLDARQVLTPILLLHSIRDLGLMFVAPGVTLPGIPAAFANEAAIGDFTSGILAVIALAALRRDHPAAALLVGLFNVVGFADLTVSVAFAVITGAAPFLGAAYSLPAFSVPAFLVTHGIVFRILAQRAIRRPVQSLPYSPA